MSRKPLSVKEACVAAARNGSVQRLYAAVSSVAKDQHGFERPVSCCIRRCRGRDAADYFESAASSKMRVTTDRDSSDCEFLLNLGTKY